MLYKHTYTKLLPIYGIQTAMKYHFNTDSHALTWVAVQVNSFGSASFVENTTCIARTSYSGCWNGPGASWCYSTGIIAYLLCMMAVFCIHTLLGAIFFDKKIDLAKKINKTKQNLIF